MGSGNNCGSPLSQPDHRKFYSRKNLLFVLQPYLKRATKCSFLLTPHASARTRLIAVVATRIQTFTVEEFAAVSSETWQNVRSELQKHHSKRLQQYRFRRDPDGYLALIVS